MTADAVVLAVPHEKAAPLIPAGALPEQTVAGWAGLGASPIVNVHVIYDRPVMDLPFVAAIDSPVQWVFDRTRISGLDRPGHQYLAISLSAADRVRGRARPRSCASSSCPRWPNSSRPRATPMSPSSSSPASGGPRSARHRAAARCGRRPRPRSPGLVLAGAWTDTGWPDTMEGAVRSGLAAARRARQAVPPQR